jgi:hypothetical protein
MAGLYPGPLVIEQGATFRRSFTWYDADGVPVDLTGYTARMMVRGDVDDASPVLTFTTENYRIYLTYLGQPGVILVHATAADWGEGVFDLELIESDGTVTRLVEGDCILSKEVSR